jgi:Flp pilus assembly protein TadB
MAIVVLVLWLFTAGAGFYLLVTSNLGRARPAATTPAAEPAPAESATVSAAATAASAAAAAAPASKREMRRTARDRFDPPSLTAAKNAPVVPGLRSMLEFAHPAFAIVGLGFWLGFTLVHDRGLGWIAFGLVTAAVCLGLTWYTANARAARREGPPGSEPAPAFRTRLVLLHGSAATVTFALAALTALVLSR